MSVHGAADRGGCALDGCGRWVRGTSAGAVAAPGLPAVGGFALGARLLFSERHRSPAQPLCDGIKEWEQAGGGLLIVAALTASPDPSEPRFVGGVAAVVQPLRLGAGKFKSYLAHRAGGQYAGAVLLADGDEEPGSEQLPRPLAADPPATVPDSVPCCVPGSPVSPVQRPDSAASRTRTCPVVQPS